MSLVTSKFYSPPGKHAASSLKDSKVKRNDMLDSVATINGAPLAQPTLDPYVSKLERFELFSTNQCYYLVGCNKQNTEYRVLKMDRTMIERPPQDHPAVASNNSAHSNMPHVARATIDHMTHGSASSESQATFADNSHTAKPTLRPLSEFLTEDPNVYTQEEVRVMLDMIHDGNRMTRVGRTPGDVSRSRGGGLKPVVKAHGIVGFIRFLDCYYLTLITRRAKAGNIGGSGIYTIKNTETIPLKPAEQSPLADDHADPSSVLLSMWNRGKRSVGLGLTNREIAELRYQGLYQVVDLTKNFYFSYTYDLTRSLQENFLSNTTKPFPPAPFKDMYAWNYFLTREFEGCLNSLTSFHWITPIVHGAFVQRKVNDYGRFLNLILIARRSRHFAGTRYLKRGVSEQGKVANDVEHEQIVHDESISSPGVFSSFLQVRGSIPTFWTQESSVTMPKPPIELNRVDPCYTATQLHFEDLLKRYSSPILVLDLVKQSEKREREVRVGNEHRHAIDFINTTIDSTHKIRYCALDYSHISKHRNLDVSSSLNEVSTWAVNQTGYFCSDPKWKIMEGGTIAPFTEEDSRGAMSLSEKLGVPVFPMEQSGILRTNCIDCLDRTNVAQFSAGVEAIGRQLVVMGIRSKPKLGPSSNIVRILIDMYVDIGDSISLQYGGSEAHKKVTADRSESNVTGPIGKHKELLTSIRRYYSNAFTDRLKQDAMNLFLGYYIPYRHVVPLWEMESDYYLHNFHVRTGRGTTCSMKTYERAFGIEWNEDDDHDHFSDHESMVSLGSVAPLSSQPRSSIPRPVVTYQRNASVDSLLSSGKRDVESKRVLKVRNRCKAQNEALSTWWKSALQAYFKQRMWMNVGLYEGQPLPPRFERVYQPEKLGQFDRFFSRAWTTPVRQSHSAQHSEALEESEGPELTRVVSLESKKDAQENKVSAMVREDKTIRLADFESNYGFEPINEPSLKLFLAHRNVGTIKSRNDFIGTLNFSAENPPEEYRRYVEKPANIQPSYHRKETVAEFELFLRDYTLGADDVVGIQALSKSAHLGDVIQSGPYQGLLKSESAIDVATAIHEQLNSFESKPTGGSRFVERELKRRGFDSVGVKDSVLDGMKKLNLGERQYDEILRSTMGNCCRSDLTTADSLKLYMSEFDEAEQLATADLIYLRGLQDQVVNSSGAQKPEKPAQRPTAFARKAARLGIMTMPPNDDSVTTAAPVHKFDRRRLVPTGFEQINDDLFSRKDNKFMVFNGAGVDSWNGTRPVTKISHAGDILLSTLK